MAETMVPSIKEVENEYINKHETSKRLYERAKECFASGVTHDTRYVKPFPLYAERASGAKKWDVDGNEFVDYAMGHGSLLFGYGDERVQESFQEQIQNAVHMGSSTELEIRWAEHIKQLVPCAQDGLVRACSSGSEAIQTAIRLARIYSGKDKIVLQAGSYHGKGDQVIIAHNGPPYGMQNVNGIPDGMKNDVEIVPLNDLDALETVFADGDVACVLHHCNNLYDEEYINGIRELSRKYGVVFIMDEVVSGFRFAAGGAQEYYGVEPDLAVLGKVIGGGAPIGAVCGKEEIMKYHEFREDDPYWNTFKRISVGGTWNAQPISIVGGIAMMNVIAEEKDTIYPRLYEIGNRLTSTFNEHADDLGVTALAHGVPTEHPTNVKIHLFNRPIPSETRRLYRDGPKTFDDYETKQRLEAEDAGHPYYLTLANNGVYGLHGGQSLVTCTAYTEEDLHATEDAFRRSLEVLKGNDLIGRQ